MKKIFISVIVGILFTALSAFSFTYIKGSAVSGIVKSNQWYGFTNSFSYRAFIVHGASNVAFATNVLHPIVYTQITNLVNIKGTAISNSALKLIMTNSFATSIFTRATNIGHRIFTNVLSAQNTNRITVRNYDLLTNWLLYVSNRTLKVKAK